VAKTQLLKLVFNLSFEEINTTNKIQSGRNSISAGITGSYLDEQ
jgi:hypothetical protein